MTDRLAIALAQLNPTVGDIEANLGLARRARARAQELGADLVVFSELFIVGYPPEDMVRKTAFLDDAEAAIRTLADDTADGGPAVLIGTPWREDNKLYNAIALLDGGKRDSIRFKVHLPNYGPFDEKRVFDAGPLPGPIDFRGVRLGLPICEDVWMPDVVECLAETGAEIIVVANGSPYETDKVDQRLSLIVARVVESEKPIIYLNQVGGQDELVFDGASFVINENREFAVQLPAWEETVVLTEWRREGDDWICAPGPMAPPENGLSDIYQAMMVGLRDYVNKNRFPGVVLGLSGGIDSALTAAVAVDALGAERVRCVMMPSAFTSKESLDDAAEIARLLGVKYDTVPIAPAVGTFGATLEPLFDGLPPDTTEENLQSRLRAVILMAISNKFGPMVLTTGNKSEMSVGYATLYGDMCGGFNVLKDVYKMKVYALSDWRNQVLPKNAMGPAGRVIPQNVLTRAPSAELRPDQTDQDSLPPYPVLDDILESLVEGEMSFEEVVARGHDPVIVRRVENLLYIAEYKRRQAPPGVKITRKNFGRDRRYPITNGFRDAR